MFKGNLRPSFTDSRSFSKGTDDLLSAIADILENKWRAKQVNQDHTTITARTRWSFTSFGENVELTVAPDKTGSSTVTVSSCSALGTTTIDWGKNQKNVKAMLADLQEQI